MIIMILHNLATSWMVEKTKTHLRENGGTLKMVPYLFNPPRSPLKGNLYNKYPLYKVYIGLIIKGTIPRVPPFSLWPQAHRNPPFGQMSFSHRKERDFEELLWRVRRQDKQPGFAWILNNLRVHMFVNVGCFVDPIYNWDVNIGPCLNLHVRFVAVEIVKFNRVPFIKNE